MKNLKLLLSNRNYMKLFLCSGISELGTNISYIALMAKVYQLTGNALDVGIMAMFQAIPAATLGFVSGAWVDRLSKRGLIFISNVGRAALILLILFTNNVWLLYLLVALIGIFNQLYQTARASFEPELIGTAEIPQANSFRVIVQNVNQLLGPATGGLLIACCGLVVPFTLNAVAFLLGAIAILLIPAALAGAGGGPPQAAAGTGILGDIIAGLKYVRRDPTTKMIIVFQFIVAMIYVMQGPLIFGFVKEVLNGGATETGVLFSAVGIGGLAAGLLTAFQEKRSGNLIMLMPVLMFDGVILITFSLCTHFVLSVALFSLLGIIGAYYSIVTTALLQTRTPADIRGRVFALAFASCAVLSPLAIAFATFVSSLIGVQTFFVASGIFEVTVGLLLFTQMKHSSSTTEIASCAVLDDRADRTL